MASAKRKTQACPSTMMGYKSYIHIIPSLAFHRRRLVEWLVEMAGREAGCEVGSEVGSKAGSWPSATAV